MPNEPEIRMKPNQTLASMNNHHLAEIVAQLAARTARLETKLARLSSAMVGLMARIDAVECANAKAVRDLDETLFTKEAAAFMNYKSLHHFIKASRKAGVFPISGARPFAFRRVDLLRWRSAPKTPQFRVRVTSVPKRGMSRKRQETTAFK